MKKVPFFANTDDDMHCFEASLKSVLKYFFPDKDYSFQELERITDKRPGLATWPHHALMKLDKLGLKSVNIEEFDAADFIQNGEDYLRREFGDETADWETKNSDLPYEQKTYVEYIKNFDYENRVPSIKDIQKYLKVGALVQCPINSKKLNGLPGYAGHSVLVYDIDATRVYLHDPGLPPYESRRVSHDNFEAAWAYPDEKAKGMIAFMKKDDNG